MTLPEISATALLSILRLELPLCQPVKHQVFRIDEKYLRTIPKLKQEFDAKRH